MVFMRNAVHKESNRCMTAGHDINHTRQIELILRP
jgi:hypothetical protein